MQQLILPPYANVHKGDMCTMGGSIGYESADLWKPYTSIDRGKHLEMVESYLATLPKNLSSSVIHSRKLAFMAENGIRQLGKPRIRVFADRVKPDPLHCEINAWQHIFDLLYSESVRRHAFEKFIATLSAPIGVISTANSSDLKSSSSSHSSINCDVEVRMQLYLLKNLSYGCKL